MMKNLNPNSWKFFNLNIFARLFIPFFGVLFVSFREIIPAPEARGSLEGWVALIFGFLFLYYVHVAVLKKESRRFSRGSVWGLGLVWVLIAILSQAGIFYFIHKISFQEILQTYNILNASLWPFTLLALFFTPRLAAISARGWYL
jgi:hypothetical protein